MKSAFLTACEFDGFNIVKIIDNYLCHGFNDLISESSDTSARRMNVGWRVTEYNLTVLELSKCGLGFRY